YVYRRSASFLLSCLVYLRALPSFPTRRSSDLWHFFLRGLILIHVTTRVEKETRRGGIRSPDPCLFTRSRVGGSPGRSARGRRSLDRKSTRLNSSHVSISYAVFCLKKKKENASK